MIRARTSSIAPEYISLTALSTERGGWMRLVSCAGSEAGYGSYITAPRSEEAYRRGHSGHNVRTLASAIDRLLT
jgi:hypothetical protein